MEKKIGNMIYKKEFAERLVKWFKEAPLFFVETKEVYVKKSDKVEKVLEKISAPCPSFVRFADENNIMIDCMEKWKEKHKDFAEAYKKARLYQEEWLMNAAGLGFYNSSMSIMALKANHGWIEKQDGKSKLGDELKQVLVQFVKDRETKSNVNEDSEVEECK